MDIRSTVNRMGLLSYALSRIGCIALFAMMCLTVLDVVGRYIFNAPILGAFEMTEFLVLIMVFSFLGYAQSKKAHVTVDILVDRFPKNIRQTVNIINYLISLIVIFIIAWMGFEKAIEAFHTGEKPLNLSIPDYPFIFFMSIGLAIMGIELLRDVIRTLHQKYGGNQ